MKKILSILATSSMLSGAAIAGNVDSPVIADVVPVASAAAADWGGFYAGGQIGFAGGTQDYVNPDFFNDLESETTYGGFAGYNIQSGSMVYGIEGAYSSGGLAPVGFANESHTYFGDIKGRVGYAFDNILVYGFAGWSLSEFDNVVDEPKSMSGMNFGADVDVLLGESLFVGAEYMSRNLSGDGNTSQVGQTRESVIQAGQIRVGWKF